MVFWIWSSWPIEVSQVWPVWKHRLGKKGEAALGDFIFVVLGTDSSVPGRNSQV